MTFALDLPGFAGFETRDILQRPGPIPERRIQALASPIILEHAASETTSTSIAAAGAKVSCGPNDNSGFCEKYVGSSTETLPIVLGVVIPLVGAFIVFIFLHRRHKKKLKKEDEDDAQKALDFGLDENVRNEKFLKKGRKGRGNNDVPEMSAKEAVASVRPRAERGLSMDMGVTNPYLLPPGLEQSRESLHSLSRTLNTDDDKYRSINFIPGDGSNSYPSSLRSPVGDDGSSLTAISTRRTDGYANQSLLKHAQRMSGSQSRRQSVATMDRKPLAPPKSNNLAAPDNSVPRDSYMSTNSSIGPNAALRASNNYLGQFISGGISDEKDKGQIVRQDTPPRAPEKALTKDGTSTRRSMGPTPPQKEEPATFHDAATLPQPQDSREPQIPSTDFSNTPPLSQDFSLPAISLDDYQPEQSHPQSDPHSQQANSLRPESDALPNFDERRGTRQPTLPVVGLPHLAEHEQQQQAGAGQTEEDEDYYDDYYDYEDEIGYDPHRLTAMGERPLPPDDPSENPEQRANRIRSFYKEYFDDSSKPAPMPAKPSRQDYYDGSEHYAHDSDGVNQYYDDQGSHPASRNQSRGQSRQARFTGPEGRQRGFSAGSFQPGQGPRTYSSASGRYGPPGRRGPPKKNLPPPKPLMALPTPHMMKDDSFLTHMPIDYAPPGAFKGQRSGTPDSLRGEMKPYRAQRAHIPLVSSFDDLAVMPSP